MAAIHAKSRPPSSAARWIPCPGSVSVAPLYPGSTSAASEKGDLGHSLLEDGIVFGIAPDTDDPDMDLNVRMVLEWVAERKKEYGPECKVYAERTYTIPETGEIGTCDITFVTPELIEIADYKNGFVFTDAVEQMMCYLSGAVAEFGSRPKYRTTVIQPNYNHRDGPIRTTERNMQDLADFTQKIYGSMSQIPSGPSYFKAGPWCKKTYCPHRGACITFKAWCETEGQDAYYPHEVNAITDEQLATALDHADVLHGVRDEYRKEAMRRIANHDRNIRGYKLVKSRQQRDFSGDTGREECYLALIQMGYTVHDLYEKKPFKVGSVMLEERVPLTVAGVERMVKQKYKKFKRGAWQAVWDEHFRPHIREFSGSLTLERDHDGRPAHTRGSEFGTIASTPSLPKLQVI